MRLLRGEVAARSRRAGPLVLNIEAVSSSGLISLGADRLALPRCLPGAEGGTEVPGRLDERAEGQACAHHLGRLPARRERNAVEAHTSGDTNGLDAHGCGGRKALSSDI